MKTRKLIALTLCMLSLLLLTPALAAIDLDETHAVSLTLCFEDNGTPLSGAEFDLYKIATRTGSTIDVAPAFAEYASAIKGGTDIPLRELAFTLEGVILQTGMSATDSGTTDSSGRLVFPFSVKSLDQGIYLIPSAQHKQNGKIYETDPVLIHLPGYDADAEEWVYDIEIMTKHESVPDDSDKTISRKVLKVWKDSGYESSRPVKITVQLYCDGKVYDTVTLNSENNWRYSWDSLPADHRWIIIETGIPATYTTTVVREGITFVITNTRKPGTTPPSNPTPPKEDLPQTGQTWWPVPVLLAMGISFVAAGLIKRKGRERATHE